MDKDKIAVTAIILLLLAFFVGGSVYAWYSDVKEMEDNQFTAGTMYLTVGEEGVTAIEIGKVFPGWGTEAFPSTVSGAMQSITLTNSGNVDGTLYISFADIVDTAYSGEDLPEGFGQGKISDVLEIAIKVGSVTKDKYTLGELGSDWNPDLCKLAGGESITITLEYSIDGEKADNSIQGTALSFKVVFDLQQQRAEPQEDP